MVAYRFTALALALANLASSSPCPFGQMYENGELEKRDADAFTAARESGEAAVWEHFGKRAEKRDPAYQNDFYKRQSLGGLLPFGGGLLDGTLQKFTGPLAKLDVPVPQEFSLAFVPDRAHPYVEPEASAVRGMCPTLNTMANHGYINRNGITSFAQAADACQITLGFGYDTCVFLSALGLLAGGDLVTGAYSIGGEDARVPNTLGPSLGISHHGPFEIDGSISREDTYFGNNADFRLARFDQITKIAAKHDNLYNIETWAEERTLRYQQDKATNPEYDGGAKQFAVGLAERVFIYRALPNGTNLGVADHQNVLPFYLNETFPDNWFRRPTSYDLEEVGTDVVSLFAQSPTTIPGNNQGIGNFIPLETDFGSLTGPEVECLLLTELIDFAPGDLSTAIVNHANLAKAFAIGAVVPFFAGKGCTYDFTKPGGTVGETNAGVSTGENVLTNGYYSPGT